jgi:hypothetical protein
MTRNLLENGDFEQDYMGWSVWVYESSQSSAVANLNSPRAARTGRFGAEIKVMNRSPWDWHIQLLAPRTWEARKGITYRISFYARGPGRVYTGFSDPSNPALWTGGFTCELRARVWQHCSGTYLATGNPVTLGIFLASQPGTYHIDDVEIIETDYQHDDTSPIPQLGFSPAVLFPPQSP